MYENYSLSNSKNNLLPLNNCNSNVCSILWVSIARRRQWLVSPESGVEPLAFKFKFCQNHRNKRRSDNLSLFCFFLWSLADVILSRIKLHSSKQLSEIPSPFWTVRLGVTVTQSTRRALAHWLCRRTAWPWHPQVNGLQSEEARQERNEVLQPAASWARPAGKIPMSFNFRSTTWSKLLAGCPGNKMHCQCDPLKNICPSILAALSSFPLSATVTAIPSIWLKNLGHLQVGRRRIAWSRRAIIASV